MFLFDKTSLLTMQPNRSPSTSYQRRIPALIAVGLALALLSGCASTAKDDRASQGIYIIDNRPVQVVHVGGGKLQCRQAQATVSTGAIGPAAGVSTATTSVSAQSCRRALRRFHRYRRQPGRRVTLQSDVDLDGVIDADGAVMEVGSTASSSTNSARGSVGSTTGSVGSTVNRAGSSVGRRVNLP